MYDVIIIGSGAGGSAAAFALAQVGVRILLLERGPVLPKDGSTLNVQKVIVQAAFKHPEHWLDNKGKVIHPSEYANLGGKTKWYGAALIRFAPHEFEADEAHGCPAWPIRYGDMEPFYQAAEDILQLKKFPTEPDLAQIVMGLRAHDPRWQKEQLPVGLDEAILSRPEEAHHFDGFASPTGMKADAEVRLIDRIKALPNVTIKTGANVVDLIADAPGTIVAGVRLADGTEYRAGKIILAGGALHSPRLLDRFIRAQDLTNKLACAPMIGRNYKCHLNTGLLVASTHKIGDPLRKTTLLFHEEFPHSSVQNTGWIDGEVFATEVPSFVPRFITDMLGKRTYGFWLTTEDGSHKDNRIVPALNGSNYARIDYERDRITPAETEHRHLIRTVQKQLLRLGYLGLVKRMPVANTAHACGTLAAGVDPSQSVVDGDGRVHGLSNLYVADGSALTRSSRVNPALTIFAWGLRLGTRLAKAQ